MSCNLDLALKYAERSFHIFPCVGHGEKGKHPCPGVFWRSQSTIDTEQIRQWWERWPDAVPALDLDKCGLLALDCDVRDGVHGYDWAKEKIGSLDGIPGSRTPSGGQHSIFRNDRDFGNSRGRLPGKEVFLGDVKGKGGYIIAPGARLKEGGYYEPIGDLADAPPIPETLVWYLTPEQPVVSAPLAKPQIARTITAVGKKTPWALGTMEGMVRDIAYAKPGDRNNMVWRKACKAGRMVRGGLFTYSEALAYLTDGAVQLGLPPKDRVFGPNGALVRGIERGFSEGPSITGSGDSQDAAYDQSYPRFDTDELVAKGFAKQEALARDAEAIDPETGEVLEEEEDKSPSVTAPAPPEEMPAYLLEVPGLVGDIAKWIISISRQPQPVLALGAALVIVGTAAGRQMAGPTRSGTHLYIAALARSGAGKDDPVAAISAILVAAKLKMHIGPSEFISMPAVLNEIKRCPLLACPIDELGVFLKRINNRRAAGFEASISGALRKAWGLSFKPMMLPAWATRPAEMIFAPAVSIFGTSTIEDFYEGLAGADIRNGLLNRFLLIETAFKPPKQKPTGNINEVPEAITEALREIYFRNPLAAQTQSELQADPQILTFADDAERAWDDLDAELTAMVDADPAIEPFQVRTAENAIRLATISAVGQGKNGIDAATMAWGRSFSMWSLRRLAGSARAYIADSENEAMAKAIRRALDGRGKVPRKDLLTTLGHRYKPWELEGVLTSMVEREEVTCLKKVPSKKGGRPLLWYWITGR